MSVVTSFQKDRIPVARPIWREAFVGIEWLALRTSPVFYGLGIPRGDKSAVIVVPGFLGTDHYLAEMYAWLRRIGYKACFSRIGWNADCLDTLANRLLATVETAHQQTGKKVHLIGHSLGGILSRSVAARKADIVASVTTLGSPYRGVRSHPLVLNTANRVRENIISKKRLEEMPGCYTGHCTCEAVNALQHFMPESIRQTNIFTKTDGIVDWGVCVNDDPATDFEVSGTHVGLAFNATVYQIIATRLAGANTAKSNGHSNGHQNGHSNGMPSENER